MPKYKTREELKNDIIKSFSKEPEISSIYFFGKEVDNKTDEYSDIDMIICSNDLAKTQSKYLDIFNDISPIIGSYLLNSTEYDFSQMVMFKDYSPYQKIDFSITDNIERKISAGFGPFISIYKDNSITNRVHSNLDIIKENQVKNQLDNFLFSVSRFTKCLFRKDIDMYRRWKNISDYTMALLYEKYFGWEEKIKDRISVKELSTLKKAINKNENDLLNTIFPTSGMVNIAVSFEICIELLITLCKQKADHYQVILNEDFILYMESFLHSEINRYINLPCKI